LAVSPGYFLLLGAQAHSAAEFAPDPYIYGGLALALVLAVWYVAHCAWKRHAWPEVGDLVFLFTTSTAIIAGLRLVIIAFFANDLGPFRGEDRIFIPLAGFALILVSARELYKVLLKAQS
jgi:hypothetical protein